MLFQTGGVLYDKSVFNRCCLVRHESTEMLARINLCLPMKSVFAPVLVLEGFRAYVQNFVVTFRVVAGRSSSAED